LKVGFFDRWFLGINPDQEEVEETADAKIIAKQLRKIKKLEKKLKSKDEEE